MFFRVTRVVNDFLCSNVVRFELKQLMTGNGQYFKENKLSGGKRIEV